MPEATTPPLSGEITGVILAGGEGRRMGGIDKGLIPFRGRPLIEHVIKRLRPQVREILISANRNLGEYGEYGFPLVQDKDDERYGPLAGILAAMQAADTAFVITAPCDTPSLPDDLVTRLASAMQSAEADLCVASIGGRIEPVFLLVRTSLSDQLLRYLESGERKAMSWVKMQNHCVVEFEDAEAFINLNTREDLANYDKC